MKRRLVPALACGALALLAAHRMAAAASPPSVLVQLAKLEPGTLPQTVVAYGSIEPSAAARQTIMAPVSAEVDAVYVRPGSAVAKGAALLRLVPSPATAAAYAQAQSGLRAASELVVGTSKLVEAHLATRQQLADAAKSQADARAALVALRAQGADGPHILRAPYRAIVTALSTSRGALVALGSALLDLARPEGLVLMAGVVPAQAAEVKPGDAAAITPLGGRSGGYGGTVVSAASVVDPANGLVSIEIALPANRWLPGEMAEATITTGELRGYVVPRTAILVDDTGATYVVQAVNGAARKTAVRVLGAQDGKAVIAGPLDAGAPLVLAGNYQLENGMKVRVADPSGTPPK
jgi:membrane fusion protein, multidrug efflux system